jgi:outer membrane protein assembly factor BamB
VTWDAEKGVNIRWKAALGDHSYGNPSIAGGKILVGTNNEVPRDPEVTGDKGIVMCFAEKDGAFLWQAVFDKLASGRANDWPQQGVCSGAWIEDDRTWLLNNRAEVVCLDMEGFTDGENDGPFTTETRTGPRQADIVWSYDLIGKHGVFPRNLATSSPLVWKGLVYVVTGNGVDESGKKLPAPQAPSVVALDAKTGELKWTYVLPNPILEGQWSSLAGATLGGRDQVIFPGGDGVVYSFAAATGEVLWRFDGNPKDATYEPGGYGDRNYFINSPVIVDGRVLIGMGQNPENGTGDGHMFCIDPTGTGNVTATHKVWSRDGKDFGRTLSTAAVSDGLVYVAELAGYLHCLDLATGATVWKHDVQSAVWGSAYVADGKVYLGDEDGDVVVLAAGREKKVLGEVLHDTSIYSTAVAANGVMYLMTKTHLLAIAPSP